MAKHYDALLPFYLNGRLPAAERTVLEQHLLSCQECRAALDEWRTLADAVSKEAASRAADLPPLSPQLYRAQQEPVTQMPSTSSRRNSFLRKWNIEEYVNIRRPSTKDEEDKDMNTTYDVSLEPARPLQFPDTRRLMFDPITLAVALLAMILLGAALLFMRANPGPDGRPEIEALAEVEPTSVPITVDNADQVSLLRIFPMYGDIFDLAWSPDGTTLALASSIGTVWLYDAQNLDSLPRPLQGHTGPVTSVTFSPDGMRLATGGGGEVYFWDVETGEEQASVTGIVGTLKSLVFSPDGSRLAGISGRNILLWDTASGEEISAISASPQALNSLSFNDDGSVIAAAGVDHSIHVWDIGNTVELAVLEGHEEGVNSVAFSPNGAIVVSGGMEDRVMLWDWNGLMGTQGVSLNGHTSSVREVAFSPDGTTLASASDDHTIRLWDVATGVERAVLEGHADRVSNIAFSPDGLTLASVSPDETLRLWDVAAGTEVRTVSAIRGHGLVLDVAFSPDSTLLASVGDDANVYLWDVATGTRQAVLQGHESRIWGVAFSPDGTLVASSDSSGLIHLWDVATGTSQTILRGHSGYVLRVQFSPDGTTLVSNGVDGTIRLWDVATGTSQALLHANQGAVTMVGFSLDGTTIASSGQLGTIRLWDVTTGTELGTLQGEREFFSVALSPNGNTLAAGSDDTRIWLWDVATSEVRTLLEGHEDGVISIAFSPDGTLLVSGSGSNLPGQFTVDPTMRLWDVATGTELVVLQGHALGVERVAFSPDGSLIVSCSGDGTIRLWEVPDEISSEGE